MSNNIIQEWNFTFKFWTILSNFYISYDLILYLIIQHKNNKHKNDPKYISSFKTPQYIYAPKSRYPLELHMVHRNIHDDTVEEALTHENGLTVLGFKFKIVDDENVNIM